MQLRENISLACLRPLFLSPAPHTNKPNQTKPTKKPSFSQRPESGISIMGPNQGTGRITLPLEARVKNLLFTSSNFWLLLALLSQCNVNSTPKNVTPIFQNSIISNLFLFCLHKVPSPHCLIYRSVHFVKWWRRGWVENDRVIYFRANKLDSSGYKFSKNLMSY